MNKLLTGNGLAEALGIDRRSVVLRLGDVPPDELAEQKLARQRGSLLEAEAVEREWSSILRTVRAGMLAVPLRVAQRLPHLTGHDVSEIDAEVRAVLTEIGTS